MSGTILFYRGRAARCAGTRRGRGSAWGRIRPCRGRPLAWLLVRTGGPVRRDHDDGTARSPHHLSLPKTSSATEPRRPTRTFEWSFEPRGRRAPCSPHGNAEANLPPRRVHLAPPKLSIFRTRNSARSCNLPPGTRSVESVPGAPIRRGFHAARRSPQRAGCDRHERAADPS
jgi:hypothetical protein